MAYADVPAFMKELSNKSGSAARALEFAILTAARTSEILGMTWQEVDFDARLWTVPAERVWLLVVDRSAAETRYRIF